MMDIQPHEKMLCIKAGKMGGEYLDSLNKYDVRTLTKEEWTQFIECIYMAFDFIPY